MNAEIYVSDVSVTNQEVTFGVGDLLSYCTLQVVAHDRELTNSETKRNTNKVSVCVFFFRMQKLKKLKKPGNVSVEHPRSSPKMLSKRWRTRTRKSNGVVAPKGTRSIT